VLNPCRRDGKVARNSASSRGGRSIKPLVIFGQGEFAQVAHFYFAHDSNYAPVAFAVDPAYLQESTFCGLPVIASDEIASRYPPASADLFIAIGYSNLNRHRADKFRAAKAAGYRLAAYLSSRATVWPGFQVDENCFILEDNTIQPFTTIGANTILWSGNHLGHHSHIGAHCYIAGHVMISGAVQIGDFCFIGVHATLRDHIKVGERCVIGMNALITADAAPDGVYAGEATERRAIPSSRLRKL
jgi:sugar O-acyltransferase (sialic acid O-acetyltransferase NeuD family)